MTVTSEGDEVCALLRLDPLNIVNLAAQNEHILEQVKEFSAQLTAALDEECNKDGMANGSSSSEKKKRPQKVDASNARNASNAKRQKIVPAAKKTEEETLRYDLAVAHRLTAKWGMDMLVWNHISARFQNGCLITPGRQLWSTIKPSDLVASSTNVTADIIHAALYQARPDVQAILHWHTPAAMAVSCLESGFVPYTQDAAYFYGKVAHYEWDGVSNEESEGPAIIKAVQSVPHCNTLLMHNHGFVCFGATVKEVWVLAYYFERACQVQLDLLQTSARIKVPDQKVMEKAAKTSFLPEFAPGACEWEALCKEVSFDDE